MVVGIGLLISAHDFMRKDWVDLSIVGVGIGDTILSSICALLSHHQNGTYRFVKSS